MTAHELKAFHLARFCACGRRATLRVAGIGYCFTHRAKAEGAAAEQAREIEAHHAAAQFAFDTTRSVKRDYRYTARAR
jgi:hypothetical protein